MRWKYLTVIREEMLEIKILPAIPLVTHYDMIQGVATGDFWLKWGKEIGC